MARENAGGLTAVQVAADLNRLYPDARYELDFSTPLELLVATILAAHCTDVRVNRVTQSLFRDYPDAAAYANADPAALEEAVKTTGAYKQKTKAIQETCRALLDRFGGQVPASMDDLVTLRGVARKTANVVLNMAFRIPSGVIVDTHVNRVSQRMGLVRATKAEKIEEELMAALPQSEWIQFGAALVLHGRYTCTAVAPKCPTCPFDGRCPKLGVG